MLSREKLIERITNYSNAWDFIIIGGVVASRGIIKDPRHLYSIDMTEKAGSKNIRNAILTTSVVVLKDKKDTDEIDLFQSYFLLIEKHGVNTWINGIK